MVRVRCVVPCDEVCRPSVMYYAQYHGALTKSDVGYHGALTKSDVRYHGALTKSDMRYHGALTKYPTSLPPTGEYAWK